MCIHDNSYIDFWLKSQVSQFFFFNETIVVSIRGPKLKIQGNIHVFFN